MTKKINILHFSSHNEDCGIAKYQERFLDRMSADESVHNEFFEYSPYQTRHMGPVELGGVVNTLKSKLSGFDIFHIQHEFGFFWHQEFDQLIAAAKDLNKKVIVTFHASPETALKPKGLGGYSPRNIVKHLRNQKHNKHITTQHLKPLVNVDLIITHNTATKDSIIMEADISPDKIFVTPHPVAEKLEATKSTEITEALNVQQGDVVYGTVGFLHKYKGVDKAIKALKFLPENYKLAVIGGMHMNTAPKDLRLYDKLSDLVTKLGLNDRVYITGFVKDDAVLNGLIQEVDMCVYPYDGVYYGSVSSGALSLAMANDRPIVAYPTRTFLEMNRIMNDTISLTQTFSYYELSRSIKAVDKDVQLSRIHEYAKTYSWQNMANELVEVYKKTIATES